MNIAMETAAVTALAQVVVTVLAPHLPTLLQKVGEGAAKEAGGKALGAVWGGITGIWSRLRPSVNASPSASKAALRAAENPKDSRALASFELEIEDLLKADQRLAADVSKMVEDLKSKADAEGVTVLVFGERAVGFGGSMYGGTIQTGDIGKGSSNA